MRGPLGSSLRGKLNKNCARVPKSLLKFDKFFVEWGMSRAIHVKFYAKIHATPPIPEGFTHSFKHFFCTSDPKPKPLNPNLYKTP